MKIDQLLRRCAEFEKLAQTPKVPKANDLKFWSEFLYNAVKSYAQTLTSPQQAYKVFQACAKYHEAPAINSDATNRQLGQIQGAIEEASRRITAMGKDPIAVLAKMGAQNLNPESLNTMVSNLKVLQEGKDFNQYRHYYLQAPGEPKEVIDLDLDQTPNPGY